jgi:hypothetical protein
MKREPCWSQGLNRSFRPRNAVGNGSRTASCSLFSVGACDLDRHGQFDRGMRTEECFFCHPSAACFIPKGLPWFFVRCCLRRSLLPARSDERSYLLLGAGFESGRGPGSRQQAARRGKRQRASAVQGGAAPFGVMAGSPHSLGVPWALLSAWMRSRAEGRGSAGVSFLSVSIRGHGCSVFRWWWQGACRG